jgi:hypothetical protein
MRLMDLFEMARVNPQILLDALWKSDFNLNRAADAAGIDKGMLRTFLTREDFGRAIAERITHMVNSMGLRPMHPARNAEKYDLDWGPNRFTFMASIGNKWRETCMYQVEFDAKRECFWFSTDDMEIDAELSAFKHHLIDFAMNKGMISFTPG